MFSQMMMSQYHNPQNLTKRLASDIEKESKGRNHTQLMREENNQTPRQQKTPVKQLQSSQKNSGNDKWHTPQYLHEIVLQQEWTDSPQSQFQRYPKNNSLAEGSSNKNRSESGGDDCVKIVSDIESINKSLENLLEAKATHNTHD